MKERYSIKGKEIRVTELISKSCFFSVYLGIDQHGDKYSLKESIIRLPTETIPFERSFYNTCSSQDLLTGAYYGHQKIDVCSVKTNNILKQQFEILSKFGEDYNFKAVALTEDDVFIYKYIEGSVLTLKKIRKDNLFLKILPSIFKAINKLPHGDIKESNLLIHKSEQKFSIIDPSSFYKGSAVFLTNTEYYPIVPPMFHLPHKDFVNYSDQLALGILLYKILTDRHPFEDYRNNPYWEKEYVSWSGIYPEKADTHWESHWESDSKIYPFITTVPGWWDNFNSSEYIESVRSFQKDSKIINSMIEPIEINSQISNLENDLVISLISTYLPYKEYVQIIKKILR
jgi:serine/threonine protein kinase